MKSPFSGGKAMFAFILDYLFYLINNILNFKDQLLPQWVL